MDAIRVREMMEEEDVGAEAFAWATVKNHDHAASNPMAQYRKPLSMAQVLDSRMIAEPHAPTASNAACASRSAVASRCARNCL